MLDRKHHIDDTYCTLNTYYYSFKLILSIFPLLQVAYGYCGLESQIGLLIKEDIPFVTRCL